jgi:RNA polymerase sigma-70 factor (ECF subfamily)
MTEPNQINTLVEHLFRQDSGKIVSVLTRVFGTDNLDLAEDVMQDSLVEAISVWQYKGIPDNPSAWIYTVAKNKALNVLNRDKNKFSIDAKKSLQSKLITEQDTDDLFSEQEIQDDQLRMIFTCCHPAITPDSQIALALKTLCGFSISEIARAYLTTNENINKRLVRAREKIRDNNIPFEVPAGKVLEKRLQTVLETIYLLFNEGYSASTGNNIIRYELCEEAIRLTEVIVSHPSITNKASVYALLSLMILNASRFKARQDNDGNLLTMAEQDRTLWNRQMIDTGLSYLHEATNDENLNIYFILAAISAQHCIAPDYKSTNWQNILLLYDTFIRIDSSPLILLNRAVAVSKVKGAENALAELNLIKTNAFLKSYYLFYSTQAELYIEINRLPEAIRSLEKAIELAPLQIEKKMLQKKLDSINKK